jgi:hypothetical protein
MTREQASSGKAVLAPLEAAGGLSVLSERKPAVFCCQCWREIATIKTGWHWCSVGPDGVLEVAVRFSDGEFG